MTDHAPPAEEVASLLARLLRRQGGSPHGVVIDLAPDGCIDPADVEALGLDYLRAGQQDVEHLRVGQPGIGQSGARSDPAAAPENTPPADAGDAGAPLAPGSPFATLVRALRGRQVAAVAIGDALSREAELDAYLDALRDLCDKLGGAPVLVAIPNVAHLDVAAKLLIGRWDVTPSGTLSVGHLHHFSAASLRSTMEAHGFAELDAEDRTRACSDQHFPPDAAVLEPGTPLGALLGSVRAMSGSDAYADRLVRAYAPAADVPGPASVPTRGGVPIRDSAHGPAPPFLSVLLRTQGRRAATLQESLLCLAAQTCDDFEVLVLVHDGDARTLGSVRALVEEFHDSFASRVRVVGVSGGGRCRPLNEGALLARGEYLSMLDDDDLVFANWVETFRDEVQRAPGRAVRTAVATQRIEAHPGSWGGEDGYEVVDRPRLVFSLDFDHVDHLLDNRTPNNGYAFPRALCTELGLRWDDSLPVLEDWDHLLWTASLCGVSGVPTITALLRSWEVGEDSKSQHSQALWETTRQRVIGKHDAAALLLDRGDFARLRARLIDGDVAAERAAQLEQDARRLMAELDAARARLEQAEHAVGSLTHELDELRRSSSWRITAGLRLASRVWSRAADLARRRRRAVVEHRR